MITNKIENNIRYVLLFFILALLISGLTAMPIETELEMALTFLSDGTVLKVFIQKIYMGVVEAKLKYPFLFY
jgi:hypothetical protein